MSELQMEAALGGISERYQLTQREKEILSYWMKDYDYIQIATRLGISRHTVKVHISRINLKLQVNSKASLILKIVGA
ncbi:helix-turn-helix transcriptional regulator [Paenibacillus cymbidii]|uniref:helix-turn-helix transcriptional regulator n=1 Tax=Paenibacillus cymbidii TaxID=1639034 RepID=UPI0010808136|nr:helix-turn-helix transcriptional regulator [Paenibacillus cymbidii]